MKKIKLKTNYPCLIKFQNSSYDLDENDMLEIEDEDKMCVYPITYSKRDIPFCIDLKNLRSCQRYSAYNIDDVTLVILHHSQNIRTCIKESLAFPNDVCFIYIFDDTIKFENKACEVEYQFEHPCQNYKVLKIENFACVQFDSHNLYCFNVDTNKLSHFTGDELELNKNILKIKKKLNDCENRVKNSEISFEKNEILVKNLSFEYNLQNEEKDLIPYRFLDAIKSKDITFAKKILRDDLQNKIPNEQLANFFGNIKNFLPISLTEFLVLGSNFNTYVKFSVQNDRISDISADKL